MLFVLDNSVTMRWALKDGSVDVQKYARSVLLLLADGASAVVPNIWSLEAANVVAKSEKKKVITEAETKTFFTLLSDLDITVDSLTHQHALHDTLSIAMRFDLSAYDAAYMELALREGIPMATLDDGLRTAFKKAGGELVYFNPR
jgi:predicted nucleic acid-binding protein